jgi:hypothetical protein
MTTMNVLDSTGATVAVEKPLTPGQALMAASRPVVLASDQSSIPVAATLAAETTKVIGTVRTASGGVAAGSLAAGAGVDGWDLTQGAIADAVVAAGATGSISAKLRAISRDIVANIVLAAGSAIIGKVGIDQTTPGTTDSVTVKTQGYTSGKVAITRPANVTAYSANDVVGGAITFPTMGPSGGGQVMITSTKFELDIAALPSGMSSFYLYLYNVTPPSAIADNGAFDIPSGDRASFLGKILLGVPVDEGSTLFVQSDQINAQITVPSGASVFGYLVTTAGYTPAANSEVYAITLHAAGL